MLLSCRDFCCPGASGAPVLRVLVIAPPSRTQKAIRKSGSASPSARENDHDGNHERPVLQHILPISGKQGALCRRHPAGRLFRRKFADETTVIYANAHRTAARIVSHGMLKKRIWIERSETALGRGSLHRAGLVRAEDLTHRSPRTTSRSGIRLSSRSIETVAALSFRTDARPVLQEPVPGKPHMRRPRLRPLNSSAGAGPPVPKKEGSGALAIPAT